MLIPIRTYSNTQDAYIAHGMLAAAGIESSVTSASANSVFPSLDTDNAGTTLYVEEKDASKAEELLQNHGD